MGKTKSNGGSGVEVNMTPLIDVSLVLVLILLVATPLALESSIAVRSAQRTAALATKTMDDKIEIRVLSKDAVRVNRVLVAREELVERLSPLMRSDTRPLVIIECEDGVTHGAFVDVLDRAKISGATEIAVTGADAPRNSSSRNP